MRTDATTAGALPNTIAALLLAVVSAGILTIGAFSGYSPAILGGLLVVGAIAASGVRLAATSHGLRAAVGITLLWVAAIAFTAATAVLASVAGDTGLAVVVSIAATLGPFSLLNNRIESYGEGTGRRILYQYFVGVCIIVAVVLAIGVAGTAGAVLATGTSIALAGLTGGPWLRVALATILAGAFIYTVKHTVRSLPLEAFVAPPQLDRLAGARDTIDRLHGDARVAIILYGLAAVLVHPDLHGDAPAAYIADAATVIQLAAHPTVLMTLTGLTLLLLVTIGFVDITRRLSSVSSLGALQTLTPPVLLLTATLGGLIAFRSQLEALILTTLPPAMTADGTVLGEILATSPLLIVLVILPVGLLAAAVVFWIPTVIASAGGNDASLAGIAGSTISLALLVIVGSITHQPFPLIIGGVIVAAVVWELGEYTTVATGELNTPRNTNRLPEGFAGITAIHTVAILLVALVAATAGVGALIVLTGVPLSLPLAVLALLACTIAVTVILFLLPG